MAYDFSQHNERTTQLGQGGSGQKLRDHVSELTELCEEAGTLCSGIFQRFSPLRYSTSQIFSIEQCNVKEGSKYPTVVRASDVVKYTAVRDSGGDDEEYNEVNSAGAESMLW